MYEIVVWDFRGGLVDVNVETDRFSVILDAMFDVNSVAIVDDIVLNLTVISSPPSKDVFIIVFISCVAVVVVINEYVFVISCNICLIVAEVIVDSIGWDVVVIPFIFRIGSFMTIDSVEIDDSDVGIVDE